MAGHKAQAAQARAQTSAGWACRGRQRMQGPIRSLSAAGVAPGHLVLRQAAAAGAHPVRSSGCAAACNRLDLGRSLEGAGRRAAVEGESVAVVEVRWTDGDVGWRQVVGESRCRRLADPAAVAGAVVVVNSLRSWDSDSRKIVCDKDSHSPR